MSLHVVAFLLLCLGILIFLVREFRNASKLEKLYMKREPSWEDREVYLDDTDM